MEMGDEVEGGGGMERKGGESFGGFNLCKKMNVLPHHPPLVRIMYRKSSHNGF